MKINKIKIDPHIETYIYTYRQKAKIKTNEKKGVKREK